LNNYNPGYFGDGSDAYTDANPNNTPFTIPGTTHRSIADVLLENNISWKTYFDQWDSYLKDKYQLNFGKIGPKSDQYCNICNPFQYQKQIMTNASVRTAHLTDTDDLYKEIKNGKLPAVSFVKPSGWVDGHPASSKWNLFEGFVTKIVDLVQSKPDLWNSTAIFITTDEGGGYYDSGYVQPLDFFGDGTRIPLIVVSPYTKPGHISHTYADHVSLLKFIERFTAAREPSGQRESSSRISLLSCSRRRSEMIACRPQQSTRARAGSGQLPDDSARSTRSRLASAAFRLRAVLRVKCHPPRRRLLGQVRSGYPL
jgi:phospholipase C